MSETPRLARGIYMRGIEPGLPPERTVDYRPDCRDVVILRRVYRSLRRGGETPLQARRLIRTLQVIRTVA